MNHENEPQYSPEQPIMIPAFVHFHEEICANAKLLYGLICGLSFKFGYCYASNSYFSRLYNTSESTVSRWVAELAKFGLIASEMVVIANGNERRITPKLQSQPQQVDVRKNADTPLRKNAKTPIIENKDTPLRKNKNTPVRKNENHIYRVGYNKVDTTLEETAIAVPSLENNPIGLFSKKKEIENLPEVQTAASPPSTQTPPSDKKEKSCAKKEKAATAITAEFERRGLTALAKAKTQPSDEWYAENLAAYGESNLFAIFKKMNDWCIAEKRPYAAPASAFKQWAIKPEGWAALQALNQFWKGKYNTTYKDVSELTKWEKDAINAIGCFLLAKSEEEGTNWTVSLQDVCVAFFEKMPDRWGNLQYFKLGSIANDLPQIHAIIVNPKAAVSPAHGSGTTTTADGSVYAKDGSILYQSEARFAEIKRQIKDFS